MSGDDESACSLKGEVKKDSLNACLVLVWWTWSRSCSKPYHSNFVWCKGYLQILVLFAKRIRDRWLLWKRIHVLEWHLNVELIIEAGQYAIGKRSCEWEVFGKWLFFSFLFFLFIEIHHCWVWKVYLDQCLKPAGSAVQNGLSWLVNI